MDDESPIAWSNVGEARSRRYGDVYHPHAGALAQSREVFLKGCGLPEAWTEKSGFCLAELGFGCGLNMAAVLEAWRRSGPVNGRLSLFSIEADPVTVADAHRAMRPYPELAAVTQPLLQRWPPRARGFHRLELPEFSARLEIAHLEAAEALSAWSGRADAWFLDGFSPALNPSIWREEVLALIAARSAPGARLATYSAAGVVRRGLAAAGFEIARQPGLAGKRHRLEARLPGAP